MAASLTLSLMLLLSSTSSSQCKESLVRQTAIAVRDLHARRPLALFVYRQHAGGDSFHEMAERWHRVHSRSDPDLDANAAALCRMGQVHFGAEALSVPDVAARLKRNADSPMAWRLAVCAALEPQRVKLSGNAKLTVLDQTCRTLRSRWERLE